MSGKRHHLVNQAIRWMTAVAASVLLCIGASTPALSQVYEDTAAQDRAAADDLYQRFEAERRRQEQVQLENQRRQHERMRIESERLRQETERREQEKLRLENERLRQENERHEFERLVLANEVRQRELAQTAALLRQAERVEYNNGTDIYEQLRALGQLKDNGILTEKEFQRLKKRVLN
ncbi:MAG: SHOCT domain-containing protein [Proteobacteria bacterium]|nr:SHOCT domain-containing protein [Pseudomonadota bacterium]